MDGVPLLRSPAILQTGVMLCSNETQAWPVQYVSSTWVSFTSISARTAMATGLWGLFCVRGADTLKCLHEPTSFACHREPPPTSLATRMQPHLHKEDCVRGCMEGCRSSLWTSSRVVCDRCHLGVGAADW